MKYSDRFVAAAIAGAACTLVTVTGLQAQTAPYGDTLAFEACYAAGNCRSVTTPCSGTDTYCYYCSKPLAIDECRFNIFANCQPEVYTESDCGKKASGTCNGFGVCVITSNIGNCARKTCSTH